VISAGASLGPSTEPATTVILIGMKIVLDLDRTLRGRDAEKRSHAAVDLLACFG
jgi:hypothetical protein